MACLAESVVFYGHFLLLLFVLGYQYENAKQSLCCLPGTFLTSFSVKEFSRLQAHIEYY